MANGRLTITDIAARLGVTTKTIVRWEKAGKVSHPKRDWRGWRIYDKNDLKRLKEFKESIFYVEEVGDVKEA